MIGISLWTSRLMMMLPVRSMDTLLTSLVNNTDQKQSMVAKVTTGYLLRHMALHGMGQQRRCLATMEMTGSTVAGVWVRTLVISESQEAQTRTLST